MKYTMDLRMDQMYRLYDEDRPAGHECIAKFFKEVDCQHVLDLLVAEQARKLKESTRAYVNYDDRWVVPAFWFVVGLLTWPVVAWFL